MKKNKNKKTQFSKIRSGMTNITIRKFIETLEKLKNDR